MDQPDARIIPIVSPGFEHRNLFVDDLILHFCHCLYTAGQAQAFVSDQQALSGCPPPPGCPHSLKESHQFAHAAKARFPPDLVPRPPHISRPARVSAIGPRPSFLQVSSPAPRARGPCQPPRHRHLPPFLLDFPCERSGSRGAATQVSSWAARVTGLCVVGGGWSDPITMWRSR